MVWRVGRLRPAGTEGPWGRVLTTLVLVQLGVGLTNLLLLAPTAVQLIHLLAADLLWIAAVLITADALAAGGSPALAGTMRSCQRLSICTNEPAMPGSKTVPVAASISRSALSGFRAGR